MSKFTRIVIEPGPIVLCDLCNADFTDSKETGGFLFLSKAVCPRCAPRFETEVKKYGEERYIRAWAKPGETHRDFVYRVRRGDY